MGGTSSASQMMIHMHGHVTFKKNTDQYIIEHILTQMIKYSSLSAF